MSRIDHVIDLDLALDNDSQFLRLINFNPVQQLASCSS